MRFESILNIIPRRGHSACETERIGFDRLGRFAEDVIMFFRDTRLRVSARAAREPSTSPWVRSEVAVSVRSSREGGRVILHFRKYFSAKFAGRKFKGRIDGESALLRRT